MSDISDSQNPTSDEEPYAGDPNELISSKSRTESDRVLVLPALQIDYPQGRAEEMGESSSLVDGGLVHRSRRSQRRVEEIGPVERADRVGAGNPPRLIDEDEEDEEDEEDDAHGVTVAVAKPKGANAKVASKKGREVPPIKDAARVTVDGEVGVTRSLITGSKLVELKEK